MCFFRGACLGGTVGGAHTKGSVLCLLVAALVAALVAPLVEEEAARARVRWRAVIGRSKPFEP